MPGYSRKERWASRATPTIARRIAARHISHDSLLDDWFRYSGAVGSGVGRGVVHAGLGVVEDGLATSHGFEVFGGNADLVAVLRELAQGVGRDAHFDRDIAAGRARLGEARGFEGFLDVHSVIDHVGNELRVGHGLDGAAHNAEADVLIALLHEG